MRTPLRKKKKKGTVKWRFSSLQKYLSCRPRILLLLFAAPVTKFGASMLHRHAAQGFRASCIIPARILSSYLDRSSCAYLCILGDLAKGTKVQASASTKTEREDAGGNCRMGPESRSGVEVEHRRPVMGNMSRSKQVSRRGLHGRCFCEGSGGGTKTPLPKN